MVELLFDGYKYGISSTIHVRSNQLTYEHAANPPSTKTHLKHLGYLSYVQMNKF